MAGERHYRENVDNLKWIIIDDRLPDLEKLAEEVKGLGVSAEDIIGFKVESQGEFEAPATEIKDIPGLLNFAEVSKTPTFDYLGYEYRFDKNEEWKKFESEDKIKLYVDELYSIVSDPQKGKAINFIFLIDLDFGNNSFCGFDILTLLRKTLNPLNYQVRFITNVPRKSIKKFIDEVYGDNFSVLGDNNHLSFISKDSAFRQLPIITKDYYEQFTSTFIEKNQKSIYDVYKLIRKDKVVCLSDKDIEITIDKQLYKKDDIERIENLDGLESAIKQHKPTIVVVNLDLFDEPLKGIWTVESISKKISEYEVKGFSVYFVTFKTEAEREGDKTWKNLISSRWKPFLKTINEKSELKVDITEVCSPIYWKFKISISSYRQFIHDLRHVLALENKDERSNGWKKIKGDIDAYLALIENDDEVKKLQTTLKTSEEVQGNQSINDIDEPLEEILWVVVGIDEDSVTDIVNKLNKEAEGLKDKEYLNSDDKFVWLVVENTKEKFKEQIKNLPKADNTVFLFDDVMPCYETELGEISKASAISENGFAESYRNEKTSFDKTFDRYFDNVKKQFDEAHDIKNDNWTVGVSRIKSNLSKNYFVKIEKPFKEAFDKIKTNKMTFDETSEIIKEVKEAFEKEYFDIAVTEIVNESKNKELLKKDPETLKNFVNEYLKGQHQDCAFDKFANAFEGIIKNLFEEVSKTKNEAFEKENLTQASETKKEGSKKIKFTKALEIIKDVFDEENKNKNFTYRILERTTWALVENGWNIEFSDDEKKTKEKYNTAKKGFKMNHKCLDFFVYSWPKKEEEKEESFFTIDRLFFMREDLKIPKSFARNPVFNELKDKLNGINSIPKNFIALLDILNGKKTAGWQEIRWGSNYRCGEDDNERILINRLLILEKFVSLSKGAEYSSHWKCRCLSVELGSFEKFMLCVNGKKSKIKVRDFLHLQYAFDIWQETREKNKNKILFSISPDSLFPYEKQYLEKN